MVYQGTVIWERQQAPTGVDIQLVGAGKTYLCPDVRTRVRDARDGATYWIRKIPNTRSGGGDLCWMETNLAYAGGGTNTYGDVTTPIVQGSTVADYTYASARYYVPAWANRTAGTTDPSASADGGATNPQWGYLYNWCAVMNSQSGACQNSVSTQPNQGANGGTSATLYNICPAGWRLPTGESTTGEFAKLNAAINGGSTTSSSGLLANGLFMKSGGWYSSGDFGGQTGSGYYWSSTAGATYALQLQFSSTVVNPAYASYKQNGHAVRCVAG